MKNTLFALFLILCFITRATNYYVNDGSTTGDIYCSAIGASGNNGTAAGTPKALLSQILSTYDLGPNDVVYIDKGTFSESAALLFDATLAAASNDCGTSSGYVKIVGNRSGTTFNTKISCSTGANTFYLRNGTYIWIQDIEISQGTSDFSGLLLEGNADNNMIYYCKLNSSSSAGLSFTSTNKFFALIMAASSTTAIPDLNTVKSCTIDATKTAFSIRGNSTTSAERADGNIMSDNTITITGATAVAMYSNIITFTKNTVFKRNKIIDAYCGLHFGNTTGTTTDDNINGSVFNNYIIDNSSTSEVHCGIHLEHAQTGSSNNKIYNNSFYSTDGTFGQLHFNNATAHLGLYVRNNLFSVAIVSSAYDIPIYFGSSANFGTNKFTEMDYNYFDIVGTSVVDNSGTTYTMTTWKALDHDARAVTGDNNSSDAIGSPNFVNASGNNLDLNVASPMFAKCPQYNSLIDDIRNVIRPTATATPHAFGAYDGGSVVLSDNLTFSGKCIGFKNQLNITISDWENKTYELEHSREGINYQVIQSFEPSTLHKLKEFIYLHEFPEPGTNYYRIVSNNLTGKTEESSIVLIENSIDKPQINQAISIAAEDIIDVYKFVPDNSKIKLVSIEGKNIELSNRITLPVGIYLLEIITNDNVRNITKLIVH